MKKSSLLIAFLLSSALFVNFSFAAPAAPAGLESITQDDLMRHIKLLADDSLEGRDTGQKGNVEASSYIAERYAEFGLKPVGDKGGYFQNFEVTLNPKAGPGSRLTTRIEGKETAHKLKQDFLLFDNLDKGVGKGALVFAGYGISSKDDEYDDYAELDVKGKVVLILRRTPRYGLKNAVFKGQPPVHATFIQKLKVAREHGAVGVLLVDAAKNRQKISQLSRYGVRPVGMPKKEGPPYAFVSYELAEQWMKLHGADLGRTVAEIESDHRPRSRDLSKVSVEIAIDVKLEKVTTRNVVGLLEGSDQVLKDEVLVIGGHLDHVGYGPGGGNDGKREFIHNGADDNASGTSAVLELIEAFALHGKWPKRSILFINFNAEERGLLGSRHYADHPIIPLTNTIAMVNLDMVGRGASGLDVGGVGTSPGFKSMVDGLAKNFKFKFTTKPGGRGASDHTSFYNKNIPVLFFFTGLHPDYHKPSDIWEKIDAPEIESIGRMVWRVIDHLANAEKRPRFTKADGNPTRRGRPRVQLGVQMAVEPEGGGVRIEAVVAKSAAEKAGLKAGDVILNFGERPMKELRDLTLAVARLRRGQTIDLEFRRGEETRKVKVSF